SGTMEPRETSTTFDRAALGLAQEAFPPMAAALRKCRNRILAHWRRLTVASMPHLDPVALEQLEDPLAVNLSAVADALDSADPMILRRAMDRARGHGMDRFVQKHSMSDLFEGLRILRGVSIVELASELRRPLESAESMTLHTIFDRLVQHRVAALVE